MRVLAGSTDRGGGQLEPSPKSSGDQQWSTHKRSSPVPPARKPAARPPQTRNSHSPHRPWIWAIARAGRQALAADTNNNRVLAKTPQLEGTLVQLRRHSCQAALWLSSSI
ncbi:hypothetical protein PtB15_2B684 [Puccinia triticina]|nr:hypothetical protein PtB15_2B684 [Puccinia triticina]